MSQEKSEDKSEIQRKVLKIRREAGRPFIIDRYSQSATPAQVSTVRVSNTPGSSAPSQKAVISPDGVAIVTKEQADFNNIISKH